MHTLIDYIVNDAEPSSSTNKGAIAGGVVGGVCGAALLGMYTMNAPLYNEYCLTIVL